MVATKKGMSQTVELDSEMLHAVVPKAAARARRWAGGGECAPQWVALPVQLAGAA